MEAIKAVVGGNGGVGKTCLLIRYTGGAFPGEYVPTVFDNYSTNVMVDNHMVNLGLWDLYGGEDYYRLRPLTYPQTDVFILCFDVSRRKTFESIKQSWWPEVRKHAPPKCKLILVGTKSDIRESKKFLDIDYVSVGKQMDFVEVGEAHQLAREIGAYAYIECSALHNKNVETVFQTAIRAHFNTPIPKKKSAGLFSSILKKVKTGEKKKSKIKDTYDDRVVQCEQYQWPDHNVFGHASVYFNKKMFALGGYKNINNELAEFPSCWDNNSGSKWLQLKNLIYHPSPFRAYPCAAIILPQNAIPSSSSSSSAPRPPPLPVMHANILIFGGKSNGYSNELWKIKTVAENMNVDVKDMEKLEVTGKVPSPRYGMTAVTYDNEMYVFGGYDKDSEPCNDLYKFNLELKQWTKIDLTGDVPSPRFFHAAACIPDMKSMVVHGGKSGVNLLDDMYTINLESGKCEKIAYVPSEKDPGQRQNHTINYVNRGTLVLFGGIMANKTVTNETYLFSLKTNKWTKAIVKGNLRPSHSHTAIYVEANAEVWVCGGKGDDKLNSVHTFSKMRITLNTPSIVNALPLPVLRDILRYLSPTDLKNLCRVSKQVNHVASDNILWREIAMRADPLYDPEKHGDPKRHYLSLALVWYNDGSVAPLESPTDYIAYGSPGFKLW